MPSGRTIRGVLANFLGTYTSRYSDFDGYWLFGYLVAAPGSAVIDLLTPATDSLAGPEAFARRLAADRFLDQLSKAGLAPERLQAAYLSIERSGEATEVVVNGVTSSGYLVHVTAEARLAGGGRHRASRRLVVAPHNPRAEYRSARAGLL